MPSASLPTQLFNLKVFWGEKEPFKEASTTDADADAKADDYLLILLGEMIFQKRLGWPSSDAFKICHLIYV